MPPSPSRSAAGRKGDAQRDTLKKLAHRFREQRGKILRLLGQSTHTYDAQFAILWVGPEGKSEVYASEAFQGRLKSWLDDTVRRDAEDCAQGMRDEKERRRQEGLQVLKGDRVFSSAGQVFDPAAGPDAMECSGDEGGSAAPPEHQAGDDAGEFLLPLPPPISIRTADDAQPTPTRTVGVQNAFMQDLSSPGHAHDPTSRLNRSLGPSSLPAAQRTALQPTASPVPSPVLSTSPVPPTASAPSKTINFVRHTFTPEELEGWYRDRFNELWHKVDKIVCKTWIKTVEPNKQTRYQYQKGDEHKPDWWPREIRHKEPDHLTKPERIALLMHLLRNGAAPIDDLELATAAVSTHIPLDKMTILHEIYRIAKEEKAAIDASPDGKLTGLTVALEVNSPKVDDPAMPAVDEPKQHNTRHRARRSIGHAADLSASQGSPSSQHPLGSLQQTPRASNRLQPYPLSRSHSVSDAYAGDPAPGAARSPTASSSGMSRSQSLAGPVTSAGRPRHVSGTRRDIKGALDEAELLGDPHATPHAASKGGRSSVTPARRGEHGSPIAPDAAAMGRSFSTGAVGAAGGSARRKAPRVFDDAVASPAMLKSRSRLSQQHFDQMVHGTSSGDRQRRAAVQQPHFPVHQHHQQQLAQLQAQQPQQPQLPVPPRQPVQHAQGQALAHPHHRLPSHPQLPPPQYQHVQQQFSSTSHGQVLVYGSFPNGSSPSLPQPPQFVRHPSGQSMGPHSVMHAPPHPHAQAQAQEQYAQMHHQPSPLLQQQQQHFAPSPHLPQLPQLPQPPQPRVGGHGHGHGHAPRGHGHPHAQQQPQPHPHPHAQTQVQVQVQVHQGHHHPQAQRSQGEYDAYGPPSAGAAYPSPASAPGAYASPHFAHVPGTVGPASGSGSPFLAAAPGGGSAGGTPQPPHSAGTQDGFLVAGGLDAYAAGADEYGAVGEVGAEEWQAYVQPLDGLGLGVETTMAFEPGYYGEPEDEYVLLGTLGAEEQVRREREEAIRRYEEHAFGIVGA